jgi:hypothetical protein
LLAKQYHALSPAAGSYMDFKSDFNNTHAVIPAKAGIQQDKNAFCLNPLDSRLRGNDVPVLRFPLTPV